MYTPMQEAVHTTPPRQQGGFGKKRVRANGCGGQRLWAQRRLCLRCACCDLCRPFPQAFMSALHAC
jgi:hypothetical protein